MRQKRIFYFRSRLNLFIVSIFILLCAFTAFAADFISDEPMDSFKQSPPSNLMFVLDDSGSMDFEFMTPEKEGKFNNKFYLFPDSAYIPTQDEAYTNDYYKLNATQRRKWKSQWAGYNKIYYDPNINYVPWPLKSAASTTFPRSNPNNSSPTFNLHGTYYTKGVEVKNAHYFLSDGNNIYLVNFNAAQKKRDFYQFYDKDSDGKVDTGELASINENDLPANLVPQKKDTQGNELGPVDYDYDLQNFANWFSFYRKRELAAKAAVSRSIYKFSNINVGFYSIHARLKQGVLPIKVGSAVKKDETDALLNALYGLDSSGGTPLRTGVEMIGEYFRGNKVSVLGSSPFETTANGGACQQTFGIVMTDGYYNGGAPSLSPDNQDGDKGAPYADAWGNTLADVVMKYYTTDLAPSLDNMVPTNPCDQNTKQHMATYTVSFGVVGSITQTTQDINDPCFLLPIATHPTPNSPTGWPEPKTDPAKIDDLWHAAINGRGLFFSASDPQTLVDAILEIMTNINNANSSGSSVSANGEELNTNSVMYQAIYKTSDWTGDIHANKINKDTGKTESTPLWSAQEMLEKSAFDWDKRNIVTYDGITGKSFSIANLTSSQKEKLNSDWNDPDSATASNAIANITNMVQFLRGDMNIWSTAGFRHREARLGDIVHSAPVLNNGVIFAGANDGMLHAFSEADGQELFAYIPNLVFDNLAELTKPGYLHNFYVDATPYIRSVGTKTYLIGGLGKGGKGYYAMDITLASMASTENDAAATVLWEYPNSKPDEDLGYTFSKVGIVRSNSTAYPIVIVFGNGYQSTNGKAMLYFMDLAGNVIHQIDTEYTGENGLSSPTLLDVNNDQKVDYAYAGDLKGNLWKFDLTSNKETDWKVAFFKNTTPKPLFQARSNQAITTKPAVTRHCSQHGYLVTFGTGKYLGEDDRDETYTGVQSFYGIWDYGDDSDDAEYLGTFDKDAAQQLSNQDATVSLLEQTVIYKVSDGNDGLGVVSDNSATWTTTPDDKAADGELPNPTKHVGWFIDLPIDSERVIKDPIIRDGHAIFISFIPANIPCEGGGDSIYNELDVCDGSIISEPNFDIDDDNDIDENDTVEVASGKFLPPSRKQFIGVMLHSPLIMEMETTEDDGGGDIERDLYIFSTSEPEPETMIHKGVETGMYYWFQN